MHAMPRKLFATVAPAVVALGLGAAIAAQGNSGSIFVATAHGGVPSGNLFETSLDPYLSAGPRGNGKCTAGGLSDGDYYFQVTDPTGRVLLSSDDLEQRRFRVIAGRLATASATHGQTFGRCGDLTVQLAPFDVTPSSDNDYRVWVVPVPRYDAWGAGSFGFQAKYSKTHNFKVLPPSAPVDLDSDGDGILDQYDHCPFFYDPANTCYSGQ